ncbi:MAG: extracellular solute-binding protein [Actinomyces sp.]|nr:extracellular solute-binding protein [Actinomyces sp.]MCI1642793.1 extracellular solute-binding protein [Actinomyces sp.]MCI1692126.1 extracellular solute-binding protein [Actinomyces sp.]MCI1787953.1 extracellular solute-binding protein [Actinomyces sp.]MCI1831281.1 extracellular solute-binding protein [Actinomyces sp.]MCI1867087.1 extracellular solute-binding protein [Actinomyces sp.]
MRNSMARPVISGAVVLALAGALAGCGGSAESGASGGSQSGGSGASCSNAIVHSDAPQVSVWAWYPKFEQVVDAFNSTHTDVQVCWNNTGQGLDEYSKFSTAIQAGTGAPDVIMLEYEVLPTFIMQNALEDISGYGANDVAGKYTEGAWKDVTNGDAVYAIPVDAGPMAMMYRKDIFDAYGVEVPSTWDEFADAAQQLRDAGYDGDICDFPPNGTALQVALVAQAGADLYGFDAAQRDQVVLDVNSEASKKVMEYWSDLIQKGLVAADDANTTDWTTNTVDGAYATYPAAAWASGYLQGASGADSDAVWQVAPLPQWDASDPVEVNQGGSSFAVTTQASDKALAAEVAMGLFDSEEAWKIGVEQAALFPTYTAALEADWFLDREDSFFGGQKVNEVYVPASQGYAGYQWSPFQTYAYDEQAKTWAAIASGSSSADDALDALQQTLVTYAEQQGFTVTEGR